MNSIRKYSDVSRKKPIPQIWRCPDLFIIIWIELLKTPALLAPSGHLSATFNCYRKGVPLDLKLQNGMGRPTPWLLKQILLGEWRRQGQRDCHSQGGQTSRKLDVHLHGPLQHVGGRAKPEVPQLLNPLLDTVHPRIGLCGMASGQVANGRTKLYFEEMQWRKGGRSRPIVGIPASDFNEFHPSQLRR